jgi:hypothetical protein
MPPKTGLSGDARAHVIADLAREYGPAEVADELATYMMGVAVKLERMDREEDAEVWQDSAEALDEFVDEFLSGLPER